MHIEVKNID